MVSSPGPATAFSPLAKKVEVVAGAWMHNYAAYPWMVLAPALAFAGGILVLVLSSSNRAGLAFIFSFTSLAGVIPTAGFAMFFFVIAAPMAA